jgi:tetratricopeptide (TPR) repeat protein
MARLIEDVVDSLRDGKCTLFIGAGCSVTAGIPVASEIVEYVGKRYKAAYRRAGEDKSYPSVMAELAPGYRRRVIAHFVDNAKINWAHIAIAQLIKEGYVDRVLTTNFDPLVMRACALVGEFPAVYDFASSQEFKPGFIPVKAVFHLHGQRDGFRLLNTDQELQALANHLPPVLQEARQERSLVVVGYSGNDPVFKHLANVPCYDYNLYWVTYREHPPGQHVTEQLCVDGKQAFLVTGYDADDFFVTLAQRLGCFPPDLVRRPFTHVMELLEMLTPYRLPGQEAEIDAAEPTRKQVTRAIQRYEEGQEPEEEKAQPEVAEKSARAMEAAEGLMAGDYQKVQELVPEEEEVDEELTESVALSYFSEGNDFKDQAGTKSGKEADDLYEQAYEKYAQALEIKEDMYDALNNWGWGLLNQAESKSGEETKKLIEQAIEKFVEALDIKPDYHHALNNWGAALSDQAKVKPMEQADQLYKQAIEKYRQVLNIKPDHYEALNNWGIALMYLSDNKTDKQAKKLLQEARKKCLQANEILPGFGAYNLACISALLGETEEAEKWLEESWETGYLPSIDYIKKDKDLTSLKKEEWFKQFLEKVK